MRTLEYGAKQAIENCLKLKKYEKLVIITDRITLDIGNALKRAANKITNNIAFYVLEDFGNRPDNGVNPLKFPEKIFDTLKTANASIYCAQGKKNELHSLRRPMLNFIEKAIGIRHAHMLGITKEMMKTGMSADYEEIQRITNKVYDIINKSKEIRVITERGTDIIVRFNPKWKWIKSDGNIESKESHWSNLPDGEVYTTPKYISGHLVIDGCLGDYFGKYGNIEKTPLEMDITNSRIVKGSVKSENKKLEKELSDYIFNTDKNSSRIGEFALGTNIGLKKIIGNLLQDEKFPGVHIAWGEAYPITGAKQESKIHCDGVIRNTTVFVDNKKIMKNGKYLI